MAMTTDRAIQELEVLREGWTILINQPDADIRRVALRSVERVARVIDHLRLSQQKERDQGAALLPADPLASPATITALSNRMTISYELVGRCMWHLGCQTNPLRCSPMRVVAHEPERSMVECVSCWLRGYYPVGRVGDVESEVVSRSEQVGSGNQPSLEPAASTCRSAAPEPDSLNCPIPSEEP